MTGVIRAPAALLAGVPIGGPPGGIKPQQIEDIIVSSVNVTQGTTQAQRVGDFLNSLGVNTAMAAYLTPYNSYTSGTVLANLQYIGATAVRERAVTTASNAFVTADLINLAANGIDILLYTPTLEDTPTCVVADVVTCALNIQQFQTGALIGIEGPNEPPNTNYIYSGVTSSPTVSPGLLPVASFMSALYIGVKANPFLNQVPIVHVSNPFDPLDNGLQWLSVPYGYSHNTLTTNATTAAGNAVLHFASVPTSGAGAIIAGLFVYGTNIPANTTVVSATGTTVTISANATGGGVANPATIRFGARVADGTIFSDIANVHVYPMFGANFGSGAQFSAASVDPTLTAGGNYFTQSLNDSFVAPIGGALSAGPTLATISAQRKWITEFGYATVGATTNGSAVDQNTQGKNILTGWLNAWQGGFSKYFIYELTDDTGSPAATSSFGLFSFTWTAKNAATWLHNFTTILADTSAQRNTFSAGALQYALTAMPSGGQSQVFQAASGTFFLVLWNNVNNWNVGTGAPITISGTTVTVTFVRQSTINVYDPTVGTAAQTTVSSGNSVTVSLADYPMIVSFI